MASIINATKTLVWVDNSRRIPFRHYLPINMTISICLPLLPAVSIAQGSSSFDHLIDLIIYRAAKRIPSGVDRSVELVSK